MLMQIKKLLIISEKKFLSSLKNSIVELRYVAIQHYEINIVFKK